MIGALAKFKTLAVIAAAAFLFGNLVGAAIVYKWAQIQETARLERAMEIKDNERAAALVSMQQYYETRPPVEVIRTEIKEVVKHVPSDPVCDVSDDELRMLNYARSGVRDPAGSADGGDKRPEAPSRRGRIQRSVEVAAHADAGIQYQKCYATVKALESYLLNRIKPPSGDMFQ